MDTGHPADSDSPHNQLCGMVQYMAHKDQYVVRLGERGRLVLPAELRRLAGLVEGEELMLVYRDGVIRLASRRELARAGRGMFAHVGSGRDLIGELLAERREEALREDGGAVSRSRRRR